MEYQDVFKIMRSAISEMFDEDEENITPETLFDEDLCADEFDVEELSMIAEEEFDIEVTKKKIKGIRSVDDAVKFIIKEMEKSND